MEDQTYTVSVRLHSEAPQEYQDHQKEQARREAALKLFEQIYQPGQPFFTVRVLEKETPVHTIEYYNVSSEYRVWFEISRVQTRRVQMYEPPALSDIKWRDLSDTAMGEIKRRVINKLKRLFRR